jgi:hypothetical protein
LILHDFDVVHLMVHGGFDRKTEKRLQRWDAQAGDAGGPKPANIFSCRALALANEEFWGPAPTKTMPDFSSRLRRFSLMPRFGAGELGVIKKRLDKEKGM